MLCAGDVDFEVQLHEVPPTAEAPAVPDAGKALASVRTGMVLAEKVARLFLPRAGAAF